MEQLIAWILSFMVAAAAPGRATYITEATETKAEAQERYEAIAGDLAEVVWSPNEKPLFRGSDGRARTAAVLLSIMLHESAFRKDVDSGIGKHARGDSGRSWCMMQINIGTGKTLPWNKVKYRFAKPVCPEDKPATSQCDPKEEIEEAMTGQDLVEDRRNCMRAGLHLIHGVRCGGLPVREWLRAYASGSCENGSVESQARMDLAISWYGRHKPDFKDSDILPEVSSVRNASLVSLRTEPFIANP